MTNYKFKKVENQLYIIDVDEKVVITLSQVDIDNLLEKYLEVLAENLQIGIEIEMPLNLRGIETYRQAFKKGFIQAKKETPFSEQDLRSMYFAGLGMNNFDKALEELKLSKIPECGVEIEMESVLERSEYGMPNSNILHCVPKGIIVQKPKLTNGKVTITKIIL